MRNCSSVFGRLYCGSQKQGSASFRKKKFSSAFCGDNFFGRCFYTAVFVVPAVRAIFSLDVSGFRILFFKTKSLPGFVWLQERIFYLYTTVLFCAYCFYICICQELSNNSFI